MWNSLTGMLTHKGEDGIHLQTGPVEWEISVSAYTLSQLPPAGREVRIFTHLHHREDGMKLFGFSQERERDVFLELQKVGGVGPRQTLKILSGISPEGFVRSLDAGDVEALTRLPGLGLKTAQKIILSLRGKLTLTEEREETGHGELIDSLVNMGFDRRLVKEAVLRAAAEGEESGTLTEQELFRKALVNLSQQG